MAGARRERVLVLCKTYPSPSEKHAETSCVAGMTAQGDLIRLFPVPFRLIRDDQQFKKWQWISAQVYKASDDRRPESHKIYVDTIVLDGAPLSTARAWELRRQEIDKLQLFTDFAELDRRREFDEITLGLLRPRKILGLDITPLDQMEWTDEERRKLVQHQQQAGLFDDGDARALQTLRKIPFAFHYRYECEVGCEMRSYRHKIADWEVGALYWNCRKRHGSDWEQSFREKIERELPGADLMFLMGTIHRFPDQWLIVSLIYPPHRRSGTSAQAELAL